LNIKGPIVDANNRLNKVFPLFISFSSEFSPGDRLINIFSSCFSFYSSDRKSKESRKVYIHKLNKLTLQALADSKTAVMVSDIISIKNQVATSIAHIHIHNNPIIKTIYHVVNVTSTKAKLFTIRCSINQATQLVNINHIIIITDSLHAAK